MRDTKRHRRRERSRRRRRRRRHTCPRRQSDRESTLAWGSTSYVQWRAACTVPRIATSEPGAVRRGCATSRETPPKRRQAAGHQEMKTARRCAGNREEPAHNPKARKSPQPRRYRSPNQSKSSPLFVTDFPPTPSSTAPASPGAQTATRRELLPAESL
ncbi:hypothetical protein B0H14DRAFT_3014595, partial [Mycena olivaceomarginata]